ncbi:hypothetical protein O3M35_010526 [Rhynocoris fuscipes]|uniref:Ionotropic glutamate receptor C-terminal domain-containing protein n=1 Tax=Rhynocoris fuscipes TaxID=488301 RepID=A0AAW1D0P7_9HEMI
MKQIYNLLLLVQCYLTLFVNAIKTLESWQSLNDKLNQKINNSIWNDILIRDRNLENDLRGKVIDAILQNKLPFLEVKNEYGGDVQLTGFIGELWHILEEHLQFTTKYTNISNERALELHLGDISLNPVALKPVHFDKFAVSIPLTKIWYCLFTKDLPNEGGSIWFYVTVLRSRMRNAVMYVVSLFIIMHWISNWLRFYFGVDNRIDTKIINKNPRRNTRRRIKKKIKTETFDTNIIYSILCILGLLTNQGSQQAARSYSTRIFNLVCMLFAIMICTSYSAVLISKLAIYGNRVQIRSIVALLNSGTYALCVAENSFAAHYLKNPALRTDPFVPYNWSYAMNRKPCSLGTKDMATYEDFCADKTVVMETEPNALRVVNERPVSTFYEND